MAEFNTDELKNHPLYPDYEETLEIIREIRPGAEAGDANLNERLDLLEDRATELTNQMTKDLGFTDPRRDDPLWQDWDAKWKDLRSARREERIKDEETTWRKLKKIAEKIEQREMFSKN